MTDAYRHNPPPRSHGTRATATPPQMTATMTTAYDQRIWKVSKALDRLSVLCEQRRRQMQHVDGLPDWRVPEAPAGVPPRPHEAAPAYFAWPSTTPMSDPTNAVPSSRPPRAEQLRQSTKDFLARLSTPGLSPESAPTVVVTDPKDPVELADDAEGDGIVSADENGAPRRRRISGTAELPSSTEFVPTNVRHDDPSPPPRPPHVHFGDGTTTDRPRRLRKARTTVTDNARSSVLGPQAAEPSLRLSPSSSSPVERKRNSTYHENYKWPRRADWIKMMDDVGGITAGGEARYSRRPILTASDALQVARQSAKDFLHLPPQTSGDQSVENPQEAQRVAGTTERGSASLKTTTQDTALPSPVEETARNVPPIAMTRDVGIMTEPPPQTVDAGTQTDSITKLRRPKHEMEQPVPTSTPRCTACGEPSGQGGMRKASTSSTSMRSQASRPQRKPPISNQFNPILMNVRYPPEPPVFRARSTYTTDFGKRTGSRR